MKSKCCRGGVTNIKIKIKVIVSRLNLQQIFFIYCKIQQSNIANIANIVYYYFYIFIFVCFLAILILYICIYIILYTLYLYLLLHFQLVHCCLLCVKTHLVPGALALLSPKRNHYHDRYPTVVIVVTITVAMEATFTDDYCKHRQKGRQQGRQKGKQM